MQELIDAVMAHAEEHYNDGGWDVIVECFEAEEVEDMIAGAESIEEAIQMAAEIASIYADRQADAINSAF